MSFRNLSDNRHYRSAPVSGDGRFFVFLTNDDDLGTGGGRYEVFVYDAATEVTEKVNVTVDGETRSGTYPNPTISNEGR